MVTHILLSLLSASPAAHSLDALAKCTPQPAQGTAQLFQCEGYLLSVVELQPGGDSQVTFEAVYQGMVLGAKSVHFDEPNRDEVKLGGASRPAYTTFGAVGEKRVLYTRLVGVPLEGQKAVGRAVSCTAVFSQGGSAEGCAGLLEALAAVPPAVQAAARPVLFGGKALDVPKGCEGNSQGMKCGATSLAFQRLTDSKMSNAELIRLIRQAFEKKGTVNDGTVRCSVNGSSTDCTLMTVTPPAGERSFMLMAMLNDGEGYLAECDSPTDPRKAMPAPCSLVFSITAAKK